MEETYKLSYTAEEIDRRFKKVDDIPAKISELENDSGYITAKDLPEVELPDNIATLDDVAKKQDTLKSGENIKTINGTSILGEGNIEIPTMPDVPTKLSEFDNDTNFITINDVPLSDYATKEEVGAKQDKLSAGQGIDVKDNVISCTLDTTLYKVVTELPETGEEHKIYLVESNDVGEQNIYIEYGFINGSWEILGRYRAEINLEPYLTKEEANTTYQAIGDYATKTDLEEVKASIPDTETYVLDFTIADGVNTGAYNETDYNNLRSAIEAGKLIIIGGKVTRVTADSQAMAADYVVIRYGTPRIGDDNLTVTWSVYELKFSATEYTSKAIHKVIS